MQPALPPRTQKIKHKATTNKPAPQGHDYEINILTLTYLDAVEKHRKQNDFHLYLATEVFDTSPFEDVVYVQVQKTEAISCYVQAKHSLQKFPIKLEELLSDNTKRDKIALTKYFESVRKIKKALNEVDRYYTKIRDVTKFTKEQHKFVIFTNRTLHTDVKGVEEATEDILFYTKENRQGKLYKIKTQDKDPECVYQQIKRLLMVKIKDVTEDEIAKFFEDLIFAVDQPDESQLNPLIEEKLREITNLPKTKWIAYMLYKELSKWAHRKDGSFLDRNSNLFTFVDQHLASWRQISCTLSYIDSIKEQCIYFNTDIQVVRELTCFLSQMVPDEPQLCVVYYEHLQLTEIKLAQAITDITLYETLFLYLKDNGINDSQKTNNVLKAFESKDCNFLVVTVSSSFQLGEIRNIISKFLNLIEKYPNKKIVLIVPSPYTIEAGIFKVIKDKENSLCHLNEESQENILSKAVLFEKHKIELKQLVDEDFRVNINGDLLSNLIKEDIIHINTTQKKDKYEMKNVENYYIPRRLRRICIRNEILKKEDVFRVYKNEDNIFEKDVKDILLITKRKDVNDFEQLAQFYSSNNIHWLIEQNNRLYWHKSQGSINNIRGYENIDIVRNSDNDPRNSNVTTIEDIENKVVVIAAEPGMGKSTLLSHFEKTPTFCETYKKETLLVIKTDLETHSSYFRKLRNKKITKEDAIEFLILSLNFEANLQQQQIKREENHKLLIFTEEGELKLCPVNDINGWKVLHLKLFAHFYNESKIIVLLDGFDEIAPIYNKQVLDLLEVLSLTNIRKMIVTTRPCEVASELTIRLNTFSYSLEPFSKNDQLNFLKKIWKQELHLKEEIQEERLKNFLSKCEITVFRGNETASINNNNDIFVSIPQHIEMVAIVYMKYFKEYLETGKCENINKDLNLYSLYDIFFQAKFSNLHEDSGSDKCKDIRKFDKLRKITREEHGKLAMVVLFEEEYLQNIITDDKKSELLEAVKKAEEKTGIMYFDSNDKLNFVHRSFAEFFAADLLADLITLKDTKSKMYETAQRILHVLFHNPRISYEVIISFFNSKLVLKCYDDDCHKCNTCLYRDYFNAALNEDFDKLTKIENMDNTRDCLGRTPLHLCLYSCATRSMSFSSFVYDKKNCCALYLRDNIFNWTPLHYLVLNHSRFLKRGFFRDFYGLPVCYHIHDNPELLQDIYGKTPLMLALECDKTPLCPFINEIRIAHHLKDLEGNTSLHYFTKKEKNYTNQMWRDSLTSHFLLYSNFFEPNLEGVTPSSLLLRASEGCQLLRFLIDRSKSQKYQKNDYLNMNKWEDDLNNHAKLQDKDGKTILHHAVIADIQFVFEITQCLLHYQAVVDGINTRDHEGKTALHYALMGVDGGYIPETVSLMIQSGADVTITDNDGYSSIEMLLNHICEIEFRFDDHEGQQKNTIGQIINIKDKNGRTVTHYAALFGNIEKISRVLKYEPDIDIEDSEGKIPVDAILENTELLEILNREPNVREQLRSLLLSMPKTRTKFDSFLLILSQYKIIANYLIENNAVDFNKCYGGEPLCNILSKNSI